MLMSRHTDPGMSAPHGKAAYWMRQDSIEAITPEAVMDQLRKIIQTFEEFSFLDRQRTSENGAAVRETAKSRDDIPADGIIVVSALVYFSNKSSEASCMARSSACIIGISRNWRCG